MPNWIKTIVTVNVLTFIPNGAETIELARVSKKQLEEYK